MPTLSQILHLVLRTGQRLKFNLTPNHFYSDIPDLRQLRSSNDWRQRYGTSLVNGASVNEQLFRLVQIVGPNAGRFTDFALHTDAGVVNNEPGGYGPVEALVLYCDILHHRPKQIVQIGCGVSTALMLRAAAEAAYKPSIVCVEPYPSAYLQERHDAGEIVLIKKPAQSVDRDVLTALESGDLLFVDSTHTTKVGSEVIRLITDVLPRLKRGVRVHFHDITWPYDYGSGILDKAIFFWRESTMLWVYLLNNPKYRIDYSMSMLHVDVAMDVKKLFPCYNPRTLIDGLDRQQSGPAAGHVPSSAFLVVEQ